MLWCGRGVDKQSPENPGRDSVSTGCGKLHSSPVCTARSAAATHPTPQHLNPPIFVIPFLHCRHPCLKQSTLLQVVTVGLGSAENARFFSQTLDYPLENLYADPTGACYKALGFSPGGFELQSSASTTSVTISAALMQSARLHN